MICPRCKSYLPNEGKFCPHCGGVIQKERKDLEKEATNHTNFLIEDTPYVIPVKKVIDRKSILTIFIIGMLIVAVVSGYQYIFYPVNNLVSEMKIDDSWETVMDSYDYDIRNHSIRRTLLEKKMDSIIDDIKERYDEERLESGNAINQLNILEEFGYSEYKGKIDSTRTGIIELRESREAYEKAEKHFAKTEYSSAIQQYARVISTDKNYSDAQTKIESARAAYVNDILQKSGMPTTNEEYQNALMILGTAIGVLEDAALQERYDTLNTEYATLLKTQALTAPVEYVNAGDYGSALSIVTTALNYNQQDAELLTTLQNIQTGYVSYIQEQVKKYIKKDKYNKALNLLKEAQELMPENQVFTQLYAQTEKEKPVLLNEFAISDAFHFEQLSDEGSVKDNVGKEHEGDNVYTFSIEQENSPAYATFYTDKKYKTVQGNVAVDESSFRYMKFRVKIYGDGELLYKSKYMTLTTSPIKFKVSVKDVEWVTIKFQEKRTGNIWSIDDAQGILYNCRLKRK